MRFGLHWKKGPRITGASDYPKKKIVDSKKKKVSIFFPAMPNGDSLSGNQISVDVFVLVLWARFLSLAGPPRRGVLPRRGPQEVSLGAL